MDILNAYSCFRQTLLHFCLVSFTKSCPDSLIGTPRICKRLDMCPMQDTNSSLPCMLGTSLMAADISVRSGSMPHANSPLLCNTGTSFMTASFCRRTLCPMFDTYSIFDGLVCTSLMMTDLYACSMSFANSTCGIQNICIYSKRKEAIRYVLSLF